MDRKSLRRISVAEVENLQELSRRTFAETFSEVNSEADMQKYISENLSLEQLKAELGNPDSEFYFAESDAQVLGYLKLNFKESQTEQQDDNAMEIERIYVLHEFLGQKIGQFLLDESIDIAKNNGCSFVWLGVWEENHRALKFYEKNGFEFFGRHNFVLGNDVQTDLLMKLNLE